MIIFNQKPLLILILATTVFGYLLIHVRSIVNMRKLSSKITSVAQLGGLKVTSTRFQPKKRSIAEIFLEEKYFFRLQETIPPYRRIPREVETSEEMRKKYQKGILNIPSTKTPPLAGSSLIYSLEATRLAN